MNNFKKISLVLLPLLVLLFSILFFLNNADKSTEEPVPNVSTEFIDLYFINPIKYKKPAKYCRTSACQVLLKEINNAQESIYFAIYGISNQPEIFKALINAQKRGVEVKGVTDADKYNKNMYSDTENLISILGKGRIKTDFLTTKRLESLKEQYLASKKRKGIFKGNPEYSKYIIEGKEISIKTVSKEPLPIQEGIMHNKYFILDKDKVWTGSTNISSSGIGGYNSNVVAVFKSKKIADLYLQDFNQMYDSELFSKWKHPSFANEKVKLNDDTVVSVYFCPQDKPLYKGIKPIIDSAKEYIYIMAFYFTDRYMTQYLINTKERGVDVKLILDANGAANYYSKHHILKRAGIEVKVENFGGKMHMKSMVIDDEVFVLGSMNFTKTARTKNNENINIIWNKKEAKAFKGHFVYLWEKLPKKCLYEDIKPEGFESIGSCDDGIDNDHDGYFDKKDYDCQ